LLAAAWGCEDETPGGGAPDAAADGSSGSGGKSGASAAGGGAGGRAGQNAGGKGGSHGGSGGHSGGSGGQGGNPPTGMIKLVPNVVAGKRTGGTGGVGSQESALRVGTPTASTLLSLKYYVTSIQLCEDAELMGTGFSKIEGCISLYQNMTPESPDYNTYTVTAAEADNIEGRYIDLMSSDGQAALRKPVSVQVPIAEAPPEGIETLDVDDDAGMPEPPKRQAGVYRYGLINFYRPIKVKAEFPIVGEPGEYFRTKKVVNAIDNTPDGGMPSERVEIGNTLSGDTEETTYMLNNGGVVFVFQKPFAITKADVDAKAEILIDLVFNPDSFGQAYTTDCDNDIRVVVCDPTNNVALEMPFVRMSPVPRKKGDETRKETYLVDYVDSTKLRIELYYNNSDPEKSIQGVDTAVVYGTTSPASGLPSFNTIASNFVEQRGSVNGDGGASVSLLDYRRETNLEGLIRKQDGSLTVHCLFPGSLCNSMGDTITKTYTYVGDTVVSN
jgi:hypothetical protein